MILNLEGERAGGQKHQATANRTAGANQRTEKRQEVPAAGARAVTPAFRQMQSNKCSVLQL